MIDTRTMTLMIRPNSPCRLRHVSRVYRAFNDTVVLAKTLVASISLSLHAGPGEGAVIPSAVHRYWSPLNFYASLHLSGKKEQTDTMSSVYIYISPIKKISFILHTVNRKISI